jgi:hypothetical protein
VARLFRSGCGLFGGRGGGGGALLGLLLRLGLFRVVARLALDRADAIEQAGDAVGRLRALAEPFLGLLDVEDEADFRILRRQRVEGAELLDEAAVARRACVGDDNG